MKKFSDINIYLRVSIIEAIVTLVAFGISSFCFTNGHRDIPLGILLGGFLGSLVFVLEYVADRKDHERLSVKWAIVLMITRFFVFAGFLVMVAYFQFKLNWNIFNTFSYCGGYLATPIIFAVLLLLEKEKDKKKDDTK